ncbi:ABC transporter permease [Streptomyces sp. CC224B]|uniref:ABC transporter permease n=1 Tax=Streptomyces sp. CC224B TaxID=3044571 RepID=UPI0024A972E6|nr:ABC transporter permease [Streptomyces sp. CC224B]
MTAVLGTAPVRPGPGGLHRHLAGTAPLLRLALRRDRVLIPVWLGVITLMVLSMPNTLRQVYGTPEKRADLVASLTTDATLRAFYGPVFDQSVGGLTAWRVGTFAGVLAAVMSLVVVVRHTREEEETGRQELISSAGVGRLAPLTAALLAALAANTALALLLAAGLAGEGGTGALALGLAVGCTGMVFAAVAAVAAQLTESARLAKGIAAAVLGAAFVLRAAGDAATKDGSSLLTWFSPVGWVEHTRAFADERWWVPLLSAGAAAVGCVAAYELAGRRDLGMSFLPSRPGRAHGRLATAGALARRLQRGAVLGWSAGFLLAGAVLGGMADGATDLVGDNADTRAIFRRMGGQAGLTDAFLSAMVGVVAMVGALYVVGSVLRLHGEETSQRAEPVLATAVGRLRWAAGHLVVAFAGTALLMSLAACGFALGRGEDAGPIAAACLVQVPAIWVVGALAVFLYGLSPRLAPASWGAAGAVLLIGWLGPALDVPRAVMNLSPFSHLPKLPGNDLTWTPVLVLTGLAVVLTAAGLAALRRRDLATG